EWMPWLRYTYRWPASPPHRRVAGGAAHAGVGSGIRHVARSGAVIRLGLRDAHGHDAVVELGLEHAAQQARGNVDGEVRELAAGRAMQPLDHQGPPSHQLASKPSATRTSSPESIS